MSDHLSTARQWIGKTAQRAALTILPLSAAAVSQAAVILPSTGFFDNSGFGAADPVGTTTALPMSNDIQGVKMELTSPYTISSGFLDFQVWVQGPAIGSLAAGSTIPISWSFDLSSVGVAITQARFRMILLNATSNLIADTGFVTYTSGGEHSGSVDLVTLLPIVGGQTFRSITYMQGTAAGASSFTTNSFTASINPVPEPSSSLLVCGAVVCGLFSRRRKQS